MTDFWLDCAEGADAADDIIAAITRTRDPIEKAPGILSKPGLLNAVRGLLRVLQRDTTTADRRAIADAARRLDVDWPNLSASKREAVAKAAAGSFLGVPPTILPKVTKTLALQSQDIVVAAKKLSAPRLDFSFNAIDKRVVDFAAKSQGSYITDAYGNRANRFEDRVRKIVSDGMAKGYDRHDIGEILSNKVVGPSMRTATGYWETVASVHMQRARTWGQLSSYRDAGIDKYVWESTLDEVTSEQCRFMHGRTFYVQAAYDLQLEIEASDDPYAAKRMQPFLQLGKTDDGSQFIYSDDGKKRTRVADVKDPGYGESDKIGTYGRAKSTASLQSMGIATPPAHFRCRSVIVPG